MGTSIANPVRAAVERVKAYRACGPKDETPYDDVICLMDDLRTLADAYLAEHASDAPEPMTIPRCAACKGTGKVHRASYDDYIDCHACGGRGH